MSMGRWQTELVWIADRHDAITRPLVIEGLLAYWRQ
jgi:hypothetical protein